MDKPSNYYAMSYEERTAWDRQQCAIEDAEYERSEARHAEERARSAARCAEKEKQFARYERDQVREELSEEIERLEGDLDWQRDISKRLGDALKQLHDAGGPALLLLTVLAPPADYAAVERLRAAHDVASAILTPDGG